MPAPPTNRLALCLLAAALAGCATRSVDVKPAAANPDQFSAWDCGHIDDELDSVQQKAAEVAYSVDERAGNNILALGVGVTIFWPAVLAMRPDGSDATDLATLKGRYEALRIASQRKSCPPPSVELPPARAAELPVVPGERLVYEDRIPSAAAPSRWVLEVAALRRDEIDFRVGRGPSAPPWRQDRAGNVDEAPAGALVWKHLLRHDLALGQVLAGEFEIVGDSSARARVRGQVVALGPQTLAGRRFDVAVIELFGDVQRNQRSTRLDGALAVDRESGVLLRLDLHSSMTGFDLQRRLARIEPAP